MNRFEVYHPDSDLPRPTFETWKEAVAAQAVEQRLPGHRARKIPESETPTEHKCSSCGGSFIGWADEKGRVCFECFADKEFLIEQAKLVGLEIIS